MRCYRCAYEGGIHHEACPYEAGLPAMEREMRFQDYERGYADGKGGRKLLTLSPAYRLGYSRGAVALETAENSCDIKES